MIGLGFIDKVRSTIEENRLLSPGDGVVVAVSGGPDSLALLHVLVALAPEYGLRLVVAHLDHGLRGEEGRADAVFVRGVADGLGLPVVVGSADVTALAAERRLGTEEAAREARYAFLSRVAAERGCGRVAVGHNQNDQAETVLIRLIRGCGPDGLAGMAASRPLGTALVIRPLLNVSREEIEAYCAALGLRARLDRTNEDPGHLRNRVRRELLPLLLAKYNPGLIRGLAGLARRMGDESETLRRMAAEAYERAANEAADDVVRLDLARFAAEPVAVRRRLVRRAAARAGADAARLSAERVEAVLDLAAGGRTGAAVDLRDGYTAVREPSALAVVPPGAAGAGTLRERPLNIPGRVDLLEAGLAIEADLRPAGAFTGEADVGRDEAFLDADRVLEASGGRLWVRSRRAGDAFRPQGATGTRKLKDFLIDAKVPKRERGRVPLVVGGPAPGFIIWVAGRRIDEAFRVGPETRLIFHLRLLHLDF
ncbi:MAG: tRNA lysidine(34) synthetase TilS [Bacillota bacterium]